MKKLIPILLFSLCLTASAQTNTVPSLPIPISLDFLTNIPTVTNFTQATFGLETGAKLQNSTLENLIKGDLYLRTNWMISAEIENGPSSTVVDSLSLYGGYRKAWSNAEVYAELGGRRNWSTVGDIGPGWQGVVLFGAAWIPITGGHMSLLGGIEIATPPTGAIFNHAPKSTGRLGVKMLF